MNVLIIASKEDIAGTNISEKLLAFAQWTECGEFEGNPVYYLHSWYHRIINGREEKDAESPSPSSSLLSVDSNMNIRLATINGIHIMHDFLENAWKDCDTVIVVSRHKSASNRRTLTVHPIGNYGAADFGGRAQTLVPAAPALMTETLRNLHREAEGMEYAVAFEVTHHGPYLEKPTFFVEIGSDENAWKDERAATAIANALFKTLSAPLHDSLICIAVGGGHYAPRQTEMALKKKVAFGHMIPDYQIKGASDEELRRKISSAIAATPGCRFAYLDKKALGKEIHRVEKILEGLGIKRIRGEELEDISESLQ